MLFSCFFVLNVPLFARVSLQAVSSQQTLGNQQQMGAPAVASASSVVPNTVRLQGSPVPATPQPAQTGADDHSKLKIL